MTRLEFALSQIQASRTYTKKILSTIDPELWFRMPEPAVTHVAWQVGHLALAEYGLALLRVRGERPEDAQLLPDGFRQCFGKGVYPAPDASQYPSTDEIVGTLDRVHEQVMKEVPAVPDEELDLPALRPHDLFKTRLESLHWTARHEMLHVGQVGLLRRLFGMDRFR